MLRNGDGSHDLAPVGMHLVDKPGFPQRIIDEGNLFFDGRLNIFLGPSAMQGLVHHEGFIRQLPNLADLFPRVLRTILSDGQGPQSPGVANCGYQLGGGDPVHSRQHYGMLDAEHLRHGGFDHACLLKFCSLPAALGIAGKEEKINSRALENLLGILAHLHFLLCSCKGD